MSKVTLIFTVWAAATLLAVFIALNGAQAQVATLSPAAVRAAAFQVGLVSLADISVPQVSNLNEFLNDSPGARSMAVVMGKALFWEQQVGSDGQACASCHFAAGADNRSKNTLNPGQRATTPDNVFGNSAVTGVAGFPQFGPNYDLTPNDFPFHQLVDPQREDYPTRVVTRDTNDVVSSQGVFRANFTGVVPGQLKDSGTAVADPVFSVGGANVRRNPPRQAPSVINAVFNFDNFFDGRAHNKFNGVNPLGPLDPNARILVNEAGTLVERQISIPNSSLASQAVGPPLSDVEMSYAGRTFPDVGKKLLAARPLAFQKVHVKDSVLGPFSRDSQAPPNNLGLIIPTYADLVRAIFQPKYWDSTNVITFNAQGGRVINPLGAPGGYTQMEANFTLFFGLAIQAYESTLVSDEARFDRFMQGDDMALDQDEMRGLLMFINTGGLTQAANPVFAGINQGSCMECHKSALFSDASVPGMGIEGAIEIEVAPILRDGRLQLGTELVLLDNGFYNIGVRPINEDLGRGGSENGFPLSASRQALQGLPFGPRLPAAAPTNPRVMVNGAVKVPGLRNVELTAPYFHNGGALTLRQVLDFYRRQGDFADVNINHLDGPLASVQLPKIDSLGRDLDGDRLVKFLLALTDERVRWEKAPFDHPQLIIPNGHPGSGTAITPPLDVVNGVNQAKDILLELPAVGRDGRQALGLEPVKPFLSTGAIQGISIRLHPGWNTLSTPVRLHSSVDTWAEFTAFNGLSFQAAYRWDGTAFQFVEPTYVLKPLDAIYVLVNSETYVQIIPYEGTTAPPSKNLVAGWNLIGSAFLQTEMSAKDALMSVYFVPTNPAIPNALWGYSHVVSPSTNTLDWTYVRDSPVIPSMQVGEGYWVYMVNPGQLSGFTSTPVLRPRQAE
ncbi:MAG: hypothetical protein HYX92_01275 [Chloroflexi bacterium]|nr:hypothetical protein [Chloroflexota bacterium]